MNENLEYPEETFGTKAAREIRAVCNNLNLTDEERETAIRAAETVGLGIAGVDLLQSARGPLVLEVNSSPGLQGIETTTETNIAGIIIQYLEKNVKK